VVATVPIGAGVDANAFDPGTGLGFSSNGQDGTLTVIREEAPDRFTVAETVPAPTTEQPRPRPTILPGTFTVLVVSR
jgi:hypothetical protein